LALLGRNTISAGQFYCNPLEQQEREERKNRRESIKGGRLKFEKPTILIKNINVVLLKFLSGFLSRFLNFCCNA
jgi:hypothetical protein